MSAGFEQLHAVAARSRLARFAGSVWARVAAAGRSSRSRRAIAACLSAFAAAANRGRLEWWGTAIAVAAGGHLALRAMMPPTVVPTMPASLVIAIGTVAAAVAWQPAAFGRAWRSSRVGARFSGGRSLQ